MRLRGAFLTVALLLAAGGALRAQTAVGTSFTYQGRLTDAGVPASGTFDLRFTLYDAATAGTVLGTHAFENVTVSSGLFTVALDFGASAFGGSRRWLAIEVRPGASTGGYTLLNTRQEVTLAPHAWFAVTTVWSGIAGKPAGFADDVDNDSGGDITGVTAGTGLTGGATSGDATLAASFAGTGSAGTVARSDHDHGTCPSGFTTIQFARTTLCVVRDNFLNTNWNVVANDCASFYSGAHMCTYNELAVACGVGGFTIAAGAWMGDRVGDGSALYTNSATCTNFDAVDVVTNSHNQYCCLWSAR